MRFWLKHGAEYDSIHLHADCPAVCEWSSGKTKLMVPCHEGAITVDLMTPEQMAIGSGSPGDQTFWVKHPDAGDHLGRLTWVTITLPDEIEPPLSPADENGFQTTVPLPEDIYDLVVAHALGHAEGYDHTYTKVLGSSKFIARKTGELMNPVLQDLGWGDQGLPQD
jgi:hypothetical protein